MSDALRDQAQRLLAELHAVRFGSKSPSAQLEQEVIATIRELDGLKKEAS